MRGLSPAWRWLTEPARVLSAAVACIAMVATTVLGSQVRATSDVVLQAGWRGAYDILVTAGSDTFDGAQTQGLVDPNFVATAGAGGISLEQLAQVRGVAGVDVAAPVGLVGSLRSAGFSPALWVSADTSSDGPAPLGSPLLARLEMTATLVQRERESVLTRATGHVALRGNTATSPVDPSYESPAVGDLPAFSPLTSDLGYYVPVGVLPAISANVVAVDPVAEAQLRGSDRAGFLEPLLDAPQERDVTVRSWSSLVSEERYLVARSDLQAAEGASGASTGATTAVPLVVNDQPGAGVRLDISIETAPLASAEFPSSSADVAAASRDAVFAPWRRVTGDASAILVPFETPALVEMWPGSELPPGEGAAAFPLPATQLGASTTGRPAYSASGDAVPSQGAAPAFTVRPLDVVGADGLPLSTSAAALTGADGAAGAVRAYRPSVTAGPGLAAALPAPLGTFTLDDLLDTDADDSSYVPSGFAPTEAVLLDPSPEQARTISANVSGVDFLTAPPGAFTDLRGGSALRGETPIDAIRVTVDGVEDFSQDSRDEVLRVAGEISGLGLTATVVAGSSPQAVSVYVPRYFTHAGLGTTDLGWTSQLWTTLGAAVTVASAMTKATSGLVAGVLAVIACGVVVLGALTALGRRHEVGVLVTVGWSRRAVARHFVAREVPGLLLVLATAAVCLVGSAPAVRPAVLVLPALWAAVSLVTLALSLSTRQPSARRQGTPRPARPVASVAAMAWRNVTSAPLQTALTVAGTAAVCVLSALSAAALSRALVDAGATRVADAVRSTTAMWIVALGVVGVVAAALLLTIGYRVELRQRRVQQHVLTVSGFSPDVQRRLLRIESAWHAGACLVVGVAVAAVSWVTGEPAAAVLSVVAAVAVLGARQLQRPEATTSTADGRDR